MKKTILLSYSLNKNTPSYADYDKVIIKQKDSIKKGKTNNKFELSFTTHLGTHIDLPFHFDENGKKSNDYEIQDFIFNKVSILKILKNKNEWIELSDILKYKNKIKEAVYLLIKTGFGEYRDTKEYKFNNPGIKSEVIEYLQKETQVRVLGIDCPSVSSKSNNIEGRKTHNQALCNKPEILLIEDMKLDEINSETKIKKLYCVPLFIDNVDALPVTVFAVIVD